MKLLYLTFLIFVLITCEGQMPKGIVWSKPVAREFQLPNKDNTPLYRQTVRENAKDYLLFYNRQGKYLLKFDLLTGLCVDSVKINALANNQIWGISYVSKDSIFLVYNASQNKDYNHTGTILRIDHSGTVKSVYSLSGLPITCTECISVSPDSLEYISMKYGDLLVSKNKLFFQLENFMSNPGDTSYNTIHHPVGGHIELNNGAVTHSVYIPGKVGDYFSKRAEVVSVALTPEGNPVYAFNTTSCLFEYELKTGTVIEHPVTSVFGISVLPLQEGKPKMRKQDDYTQASFERLIYNQSLQQYMRFTRLALPTGATPENKRYPSYGITLLNEYFNVIGEGVLPPGLSDYAYTTKTGFGFWQDQKTQTLNSDKVYFSEYTFQFKGVASNKLSVQAKTSNIKIGFETYTANFKPPANDYVLVFIPVSQSCRPCITSMVNYVKTKIPERPIYLLLADNNKSALKTFRSDLLLTSSSHILEDTTGLFKQYLEPPVINGTIGFYEKGVLVKELQIVPGQGEALRAQIEKFVEVKKM